MKFAVAVCMMAAVGNLTAVHKIYLRRGRAGGGAGAIYYVMDSIV